MKASRISAGSVAFAVARREIAAVAEMPAAAHHRQVDAGAARPRSRPPGCPHRRRTVFSTDCWCSTRDSAPSLLRISAACSNSSSSAWCIRVLQLAHDVLGFAAQKAHRAVDVLRVARASISSTQGALQRWIWYSRQGRERLANTVSSQVRSRNTFCSSWMLPCTAQALGYGPKYCARRSTAPR